MHVHTRAYTLTCHVIDVRVVLARFLWFEKRLAGAPWESTLEGALAKPLGVSIGGSSIEASGGQHWRRSS